MKQSTSASNAAASGLLRSAAIILTVLALWPVISPAQQMVTSGTFSVSPGGAAAYEIPIKVPPGTAGLQPKLALTFNSMGDNAAVGVGWSLSGLSSINRCPKTIAQDGAKGGVSYDSNDRYCLDGQRLMLVSGTYGADSAEYRTELDTFSKIISYGSAGSGPSWFKVWTKAGLIMEYGNTSDSKIEAQGKSSIRVWAVNKISDRSGNYMTASYSEDGTNGVYYVTQLDYTGNSAASLSTGESVQFSYQSRTDSTPTYVAGSLIKETSRLTHIKTYVGATAAKDYQLTYEYGAGSGKSRLISVTECNGNASLCFPALNLAWSDTSAISFSPNSGGLGANYGTPIGYSPIAGDFNGDGRTDFGLVQSNMVYTFLSNGDGTFTANSQNLINNYGAPVWFTNITGDFNGDGKTDFAFAGASSLYVMLSNGDGTFTTHYQSLGADFGTPISYLPIIGDFDGDGRTDFAFVQGNMAYTFLSNGDGSFTANSQNLVNNYGAPVTFTPIVGDFNGDGKADFALAETSTIFVLLSNGDGTFTTTSQSLGANFGTPISYLTITGDFNADGKTDFAFAQANMVYSFLSQGDGTFALNSQNVSNNYGTPISYKPIIGDFNGDGKTDYALASGSDLYILSSNGDGTFATTHQTLNANFGSPISYLAIGGDFNGDGKADFAFAQANMVYSEMSAGAMPDLGVSITDGLGVTASINYYALSNGGIYTKDSGGNAATYPIVDIQGPIYVVGSVVSGNGIGGAVETDYSYAGMKTNAQGRGLIGFRQIQLTDVPTGIKVLTTYRQDFPYIGLPSQVKKSTASNTVLSQVDNTLTCNDFNSGCSIVAGRRYFPYISQAIYSGHDLNGASLPTVTTTYQYDGYGNNTQTVSGTGDGYTKTLNSTYTNDVTYWLLGQLTGTQAISTTP